MKTVKFVLAAAIMACAGQNLRAQSLSEAMEDTSRWSFGLGGGVNISQLHISDIDKSVFPNSKSNTSGLFSVYVEGLFGPQRSFGVRPQLTFLTRGGHLTDIYSNAKIDADADLSERLYSAYGIEDIRYGLKATYVDIRVPLTYYVGAADWRFRPFVYIAPILGFAHNGYIDCHATGVDGAYAGVRYDLSKANYNSFLFAGAIGIGARYQFVVNGTACNLGLDLSYQYGFTDTYSKDEKDGNVKNVVSISGSGRKIEGSRRISGFEVAASVGIPFSVFKAKERRPCETVYVTVPETPAPAPAPVVEEEKPCYSLEEINAMMNSGKDVKGKTICAIDDNINFDFGKSDIKPSSYPYLNRLAETLSRTGANITVNGHTDNVGNEEFNMELSRRRALAVMNYLKSRGVSDSKLSYKAYGMTRPLVSNDTEEGRRLNRRVEFEIR